MPRVRKERPTVRQHPDEAPQKAQRGQDVHLRLHPVFLIEEPPARAELDLAGRHAVLEVPEHRPDQVIVDRVQIVEDRPREFVLTVQRVEVARHGQRAVAVADRVEPRVRAERLEFPRIIVPHRAEVELLGPAKLGVHAAKLEQNAPLEGVHLVRRELERVVGQRLLEDPVRALPLEFGGQIPVQVQLALREKPQTMVGEAAADRVEEDVAVVQGVDQRVKVPNGPTGHAFQRLEPGEKDGWAVDRHRLVGPERRQDARFENSRRIIGRDPLMVLERIDRVVGGADRLDVHLGHDPPRRALRCGEHRVAVVPDGISRGGREESVVDPERAVQLEVGPVVERIAERIGDGFRPFVVLLPVGRVSGAEPFGHAVAAHGAPFVVVAVKPDLREVFVRLVLGDLLRRQVAVVIDDGQILGVLVIQHAGKLGFEEEIFVNERGFESFGHFGSFIRGKLETFYGDDASSIVKWKAVMEAEGRNYASEAP